MSDTNLEKKYPSPSALQSLEIILKIKSNFLVACWLIYTSIVLFFMYVMDDNPFAMKVGIILFIMCFFISYKKAKFTSKDYYSLPTSKNDLAIHNCVYCGHDEIEVKQSLFYKSNYCKQCQEYLYSE